jgi:hypothetical protein
MKVKCDALNAVSASYDVARSEDRFSHRDNGQRFVVVKSKDLTFRNAVKR